MTTERDLIAEVHRVIRGTMIEHLGIEITGVDDTRICGRMPVDHRTIQPLGTLHGGASAALAESLASIGGSLLVDYPNQVCVGLEINANHLKRVTGGYVHGTATPLRIGARTQVWDIRITDDQGDLVCVSRMTLAVRTNRREK
jgi:1,4-dihydroxy-2-naphthoyl-CoA hydrolase